MRQDEDEPDDENDRELFRRAVRDVRPLKQVAAIPPRRPRRTRGRSARAGEAALLPERTELGSDLYELQPGDELQFRRPGVPETVLRRLRRESYRVDAEIDLHGLTLAEALGQLDAFLQEAHSRQLQCLRIIHGKGLRSGTRGPVLKNLVNARLRHSAAVIAFASARPVAGGTGATLVLLSRR